MRDGASLKQCGMLSEGILRATENVGGPHRGFGVSQCSVVG